MSLPLGFTPTGLLVFVALTLFICTTVNTFAMEAAVLFVPAFMFLYPDLVPAFPAIELHAAIGLALFVELFGYTSSVGAYWARDQVDLDVAKSILAISIPVAVVTRALAYYAPTSALKLLFGGMLVVLAAVLFEGHREGPPATDWFDGTPLEFIVPTTGDDDDARPDGGVRTFDRFDRGVAAIGGAMAGFVAIAIGELTQVLLTVRKRLPIRISTGTSALVLHGTIVAALVTNLVLLAYAPPSFSGHEFTVPFGFGFAAGLCCFVGGQIGAYLNSRIPEQVTMRAMMLVYSLVGVFMVARVLVL